MKRPSLQPSTSGKAFAILAAAGICLAACQTLVTSAPLAELLAPLDVAMSEQPGTIEARAQNGDGQAQLAMAIIEEHGLQGRTPDRTSAVQWRQRAQENRRFMPITQYTAAFNSQPSRVNIINVPVQSISAAQWQAVDKCVALLSSVVVEDPEACGGVDETRQRRMTWVQAAQR